MASDNLEMFVGAALGINPGGKTARRQAVAQAATVAPDAQRTFTRTHAPRGGRSTSRRAAGQAAIREAAGPTVKNCQGRILQCLDLVKPVQPNATSDEIKRHVVRYAWQRLTDLETLGYIQRVAGIERPSDKGQPMAAYAITDKGTRWMKAHPVARAGHGRD